MNNIIVEFSLQCLCHVRVWAWELVLLFVPCRLCGKRHQHKSQTSIKVYNYSLLIHNKLATHSSNMSKPRKCHLCRKERNHLCLVHFWFITVIMLETTSWLLSDVAKTEINSHFLSQLWILKFLLSECSIQLQTKEIRFKYLLVSSGYTLHLVEIYASFGATNWL